MLVVAVSVVLNIVQCSKVFSCPVKLQGNEEATKEFLAIIQKLIEGSYTLDF